MYDFWYTLGATAIDPTLLAAIKKPVFNFGQRLIIENVDSKPALRIAHSTGQLDNQATTDARAQIAGFFAGKKAAFPAAPPIGIYTGGRFCQLMTIRKFDSGDPQSTFARIIQRANTAYGKGVAAVSNPQSVMFPAFLGLLMMDQKFVVAFDGLPAAQVDPAVKEIFGEFGIKVVDGNPDFELAKAIVKTQEFKDSVADLMGPNNLNPWSDGGTTLEQALFWSNKSEYAIT